MRTILFCFICATISFSACNSSKKTNTTTDSATVSATQDIAGKRWKLVELQGKAVGDSINGKQPFLEFKSEDSSYSGTAGCNGIGGSYILSEGNRIQFKLGMSTMMFCEQMEIEDGLKKILEQVDNYSVNGNELSLNKARMAPLARFKAVEAASSASLEGTWELNYISGPRIAFEGLYPNKKPTIIFNLAEGKANGNSGCNNYNTSFTINGNNIQFGDAISTRMACEGAGEPTFLNTLKKINSYSISGTTLNLIIGDVAMMRFEKK